jgi:transposase
MTTREDVDRAAARLMVGLGVSVEDAAGALGRGVAFVERAVA